MVSSQLLPMNQRGPESERAARVCLGGYGDGGGGCGPGCSNVLGMNGPGRGAEGATGAHCTAGGAPRYLKLLAFEYNGATGLAETTYLIPRTVLKDAAGMEISQALAITHACPKAWGKTFKLPGDRSCICGSMQPAGCRLQTTDYRLLSFQPQTNHKNHTLHRSRKSTLVD